jgi:hypothetical protein
MAVAVPFVLFAFTVNRVLSFFKKWIKILASSLHQGIIVVLAWTHLPQLWTSITSHGRGPLKTGRKKLEPDLENSSSGLAGEERNRDVESEIGESEYEDSTDQEGSNSDDDDDDEGGRKMRRKKEKQRICTTNPDGEQICYLK